MASLDVAQEFIQVESIVDQFIQRLDDQALGSALHAHNEQVPPQFVRLLVKLRCPLQRF